MRNEPIIRLKCETCEIKIPKNQPILRCTICNKIKHLTCQKLTKSDAKHILALKFPWSCNECITSILPVGTCATTTNGRNKMPRSKFKFEWTPTLYFLQGGLSNMWSKKCVLTNSPCSLFAECSVGLAYQVNSRRKWD